MSDRYLQHYIGGEWVDASDGGRIAIEDPATAELLGEVARAGTADVDRAVAAARACADSQVLTKMRPGDRGRLIADIARYLYERQEEIGELITLDSGKNLEQGGWEAASSARYFEYYAGLADKIEGSYIPLGEGYVDYVMPVPYGVSAQIIPWNYPISMVARGVPAALAAGNAVVVKSPELDPLSIGYVADAADAVGLPPGALNIICGYGPEAGAHLAAHPDIDQLVFTGSVATGRKILHAAAERIIPAVVELGGKSAGIVMPDADLDLVAEQTKWGIFLNSGQACNAMSRLVVHSSVYDEVVDRVSTMAAGLSAGPGIDGHDITPLISAGQLDRVSNHVTIGKDEGASAVTGGGRVDRPGHFHEPTVFAGVTNDMTIAREEIFGPVLSILAFDDIDESVAIANDSKYGLAAGIFTQDLDWATWAADHLEAGQVYVNEWYAGGEETPFGGFKNSGFGREKGQAALANYYQLKNVGIRRPRA